MNSFKFFRGFVVDVETELTNMLSEQIAREIDNNIIDELTRRINGDEPSIFEGRIQRLNTNLEYFNRWMDIGGQRA